MAKHKDLFNVMEEIAPDSLAMEWDRVGLQIGDPEDDVKGIMVALDPSLDAVEEAARLDLNLLLTHHPLLLSPLYSIDINSPVGRILRSAIENRISIFSAHTNLDRARGGVNDMLADILGIDDAVPLEPAACEAGMSAGLGRIGALKAPQTLGEIVSTVKERLPVDSVRVLGDLERKINRIAVCGGSGGGLIVEAAEMGADLLVTGDVRYHQAREAEDLGLALIDAGHFATEKIAVGGLASLLRGKLDEKGLEINVKEYDREEEPFKIL